MKGKEKEKGKGKMKKKKEGGRERAYIQNKIKNSQIQKCSANQTDSNNIRGQAEILSIFSIWRKVYWKAKLKR